jgi:hypothetical protein
MSDRYDLSEMLAEIEEEKKAELHDQPKPTQAEIQAIITEIQDRKREAYEE